MAKLIGQIEPTGNHKIRTFGAPIPLLCPGPNGCLPCPNTHKVHATGLLITHNFVFQCVLLPNEPLIATQQSLTACFWDIAAADNCLQPNSPFNSMSGGLISCGVDHWAVKLENIIGAVQWEAIWTKPVSFPRCPGPGLHGQAVGVYTLQSTATAQSVFIFAPATIKVI